MIYSFECTIINCYSIHLDTFIMANMTKDYLFQYNTGNFDITTKKSGHIYNLTIFKFIMLENLASRRLNPRQLGGNPTHLSSRLLTGQPKYLYLFDSLGGYANTFKISNYKYIQFSNNLEYI